MAAWARAQARKLLPQPSLRSGAGGGGPDPAGLGQAEDGGAIEAAGSAAADLLSGRALAQLGGVEPGLQAPVLAPGGLAVDEQAQPLLEAQLGVLDLLHLLAQAVGHGGQ